MLQKPAHSLARNSTILILPIKHTANTRQACPGYQSIFPNRTCPNFAQSSDRQQTINPPRPDMLIAIHAGRRCSPFCLQHTRPLWTQRRCVLLSAPNQSSVNTCISDKELKSRARQHLLVLGCGEILHWAGRLRLRGRTRRLRDFCQFLQSQSYSKRSHIPIPQLRPPEREPIPSPAVL